MLMHDNEEAIKRDLQTVLYGYWPHLSVSSRIDTFMQSSL